MKEKDVNSVFYISTQKYAHTQVQIHNILTIQKDILLPLFNSKLNNK